MNKVEYSKPIYTYEIDANQHVSNIAYIQWMEVGRLKLLDEVGLSVHEINDRGFAPVLVRTEIDYKKPLFIGDEAKVVLWLSEMKSISARIHFDFYNQHDELVASGDQVGLFVDLKTQRAYKLSDEERQRFEPYLATP